MELLTMSIIIWPLIPGLLEAKTVSPVPSKIPSHIGAQKYLANNNPNLLSVQCSVTGEILEAFVLTSSIWSNLKPFRIRMVTTIEAKSTVQVPVLATGHQNMLPFSFATLFPSHEKDTRDI